MPPIPSDDFHARLADSEMAGRLRLHDWEASAVGTPARLPERLRVVLELCLASQFPMAVWWGADLIQFYNDSYRPILGALKHPNAFGKPARETWAEVWATIGPLVDQVMQQGLAVKGDDMPLTLERNGYPELCHFTFSYSPIFDDAGRVVGMFTTAVETTAWVSGERRRNFQLAMADRLRALARPREITVAAAELVMQHLNVSRAFYAELDDEDKSFSIPAHWLAANALPELPADGRIAEFGSELLDCIQHGQPFVVDNVEADPRTALHATQYAALGIHAIVVAPLVKDGRLRANFNVADTTPRRWTSDEVNMVMDVGERIWDAIERTRAERALHRAYVQSQYIFDSMSEGFALVDHDWNILRMNAAGLLIVQRREADVLGHNHWDVWPRMEGSDAEKMYRLAKDEHVAGTVELLHVLPDATRIWLEVRAYPSLDQGLAFFFRDITHRKATEEKLRHASLHDALTGLPNRAMLFEYAEHVLPHNKRAGQSAALLFLDLDRFKPVNDTHGHETGDELLKQVATRLSDCLRAEDVVVRVGGDEFLVFLQNIRQVSYAADVARHVIEQIAMPYHVGDLTLSLSASVGISIYPPDGQDIDMLISRADAAMYQAKQAGRNNFQYYSSRYAASLQTKLSIEKQLRSALMNNAFHLCYQPIVDLKTHRVVSVEALLRLTNHDLGPAEFVPVAEATGIINPIGKWVLQEASRQHNKWTACGLPAIPIAVNISAVEFGDHDFVTRFETLIRDFDIDANALQLELTETAVMDNIDHAIMVLSKLQALGVTILLDDFGTGHSSLQYLARLPLNKMKIDKSFINRLESDVASRAVTDAMLALGHTLNLEVVAEGVESATMLDYVASRGCHQAQGFFFSRPMPGDAFESWYRQQAQSGPRP